MLEIPPLQSPLFLITNCTVPYNYTQTFIDFHNIYFDRTQMGRGVRHFAAQEQTHMMGNAFVGVLSIYWGSIFLTKVG